MNLILFGFKGAGKTHFGKKLAIQMERPFIDTDDLLLAFYTKETGHRKNARAIYETLGPESFRAFEKRVVHTLTKGDAIIALGGGTILDPKTAAFLQTIGILVYLKAAPATLKKRIFQQELPLFLDSQDRENSFLQMIHEREPIYRSIPARTIDTETLDEAGVLAALKATLLLEEPPHGL